MSGYGVDTSVSGSSKKETENIFTYLFFQLSSCAFYWLFCNSSARGNWLIEANTLYLNLFRDFCRYALVPPHIYRTVPLTSLTRKIFGLTGVYFY